MPRRLVAQDLEAEGTSRNVTVIADAGDIRVSRVTAEGDLVFLQAFGGSIVDDQINSTEIVSSGATLTAGRGVGMPPSAGSSVQIDTACDTVNATSAGVAGAGAPGIWIGEKDAVTLTATAAEGQVAVTSGGAMSASDVRCGGANGHVLLTATTGNLVVGSVTAEGDTVSLS